jgi:hypothetical protein
MCAPIVPHLFTPDEKHQHAASSVEFVEMIGDDRNVLKRIATGDEFGVLCTIQKWNVTVQLG